MLLLLIVLGIGVLVMLGGVVAFVARLRSAQARIRQQVSELDVQRSASVNFYGVASKGAGQVRGNGTLVLTADDLLFFQLMPSREIRVPRAAITGTDVAGSFLGKTQGRTLLVVCWLVDGVEDRAAFLVNDLEAWRTALA